MHLTLRDFTFILLPPVVVALLYFISSFAVFLPTFEKNLLSQKKEMLKELTHTTWSILASYEEMAANNTISKKDARRQAIATIRKIRYGKEQKDYFWINDMRPVMVMHPYRIDLEGRDLSNFTDPSGNFLFNSFVKIVESSGEGYVSYMWQWKDDDSRIVPKLSYVKEFAPWGWIIGTGIYLDDIEAEIASIKQSMLLFSIVVLFIVSILSFFIVVQGLKRAEKHRKAEKEVKLHRDHLEELVEKRTSELNTANEQLKVEIVERKQAQEEIKEEHAFLETVLESLPFPFYVINAEDYTVVMANSQACDKDEILCGKCYEMTHNRSSPCIGEDHICPLESVKKKKQPVKTEHLHTGKQGEKIYVEVHGYPILDKEGNVEQMIEFALDITKRKKLEKQLLQSSITDSLTGLYNRRGFMIMAQKQLDLSKRIARDAHLLFIDLDNMKTINDSFGHEMGDQALIATARLLNETFREADTLSRFGGDEFAAFLFDAKSVVHDDSIVNRLEENLARLNTSKEYLFELSLSYGVVSIDRKEPKSLEDLLNKADTLMYQHKKTKKENNHPS